jgi:N6-adenosine-specific RNA methylase IME4
VTAPWPFDPLSPFAYDVAMIDPPWPWAAYSTKGLTKSPEAQYKTMSFDEIGALPVGDLMAPSGVLFVWCTWPLIAQQSAVVARWGFQVKSGGSWVKRTPSKKLRWGTGYLLRSVCEPFLIATLPASGFRGSREINLIETEFGEGTVIDGVAREHSRKPEEAYALIERIMAGKRFADVFSRQTRPGWSSWGNEANKFDADPALVAPSAVSDFNQLVGE